MSNHFLFVARKASNPTLRALCLLLLVLALVSCASAPFQGTEVDSQSFLDRAVTQEDASLRVTTAVPTAEESLALTGLDLYEQGIQPVWFNIENRGSDRARVALWSVDKEYLSPIEVAYMNRKKFSKEGYQDMERWFYKNGLPRFIPPGENRSGLVFTHLKPGTKGFNLVVFSNKTAHDFTFFVPLPGFVSDYMKVDFNSLYAENEIQDLDRPGLKQMLIQDLPCCASDETGEAKGMPFNVALIGSGPAIRRAMLRGDWLETSSDPDIAVEARQQRFEGRQPDAVFSMKRPDGNERIFVTLWLTRWRVNTKPVWVGQVVYYPDEKSFFGEVDDYAFLDSDFLLFLTRESIAADLDSAQRFLFQNYWYNGSLKMVGFVEGVGEYKMDEPGMGFNRIPYFTDGMRLVMTISEDPVAIDETQFFFGQRGVESEQKDEEALFQGKQVEAPNDRLHVRSDGNLIISAAVPSVDETRQMFGVNLYSKDIQPVWVQVENQADNTVYLTPMGLDPAYFTPREAANRFRERRDTSHSGQFEERGHIRMAVPARSIQSGYIFSRVDEGTKSFNIDVIGDGETHMLTFNIPVPGLRLDHYNIDLEAIYDDSELKHVDLPLLVAELEAMPCCVHDKKGKTKGDPLNIVLIGGAKELYWAFMRAGWDETETIYSTSLIKTAKSTLFKSSYRYSPVSALYVFGRPQDAAFQRIRSSIDERNHFRLWLTPLRYEGEPVWIGQISRDIGVHFTRKTITTHKIDPDVDETREYLVEDLAFSQSLRAFGYLGGVGSADYDNPRGNLTGDPYFTDGRRVVMWISGNPSGLDEVQIMDLDPYHKGIIGD